MEEDQQDSFQKQQSFYENLKKELIYIVENKQHTILQDQFDKFITLIEYLSYNPQSIDLQIIMLIKQIIFLTGTSGILQFKGLLDQDWFTQIINFNSQNLQNNELQKPKQRITIDFLGEEAYIQYEQDTIENIQVNLLEIFIFMKLQLKNILEFVPELEIWKQVEPTYAFLQHKYAAQSFQIEQQIKDGLSNQNKSVFNKYFEEYQIFFGNIQKQYAEKKDLAIIYSEIEQFEKIFEKFENDENLNSYQISVLINLREALENFKDELEDESEEVKDLIELDNQKLLHSKAYSSLIKQSSKIEEEQQQEQQQKPNQSDDIAILNRDFFILDEKLDQDEDNFIEFKRYKFPFHAKGEIDPIFNLKKTICGFLNTNGGTLFLGIEDSEIKVEGIFLPTKLQDELKLFVLNIIAADFHPKIDLASDAIKTEFIPVVKQNQQNQLEGIKGKWVVRITVQQGERNQLYSFKYCKEASYQQNNNYQQKNPAQQQDKNKKISYFKQDFSHLKCDGMVKKLDYIEQKEQIFKRAQKPIFEEAPKIKPANPHQAYKKQCMVSGESQAPVKPVFIPRRPDQKNLEKQEEKQKEKQPQQQNDFRSIQKKNESFFYKNKQITFFELNSESAQNIYDYLKQLLGLSDQQIRIIQNNSTKKNFLVLQPNQQMFDNFELIFNNTILQNMVKMGMNSFRKVTIEGKQIYPAQSETRFPLFIHCCETNKIQQLKQHLIQTLNQAGIDPRNYSILHGKLSLVINSQDQVIQKNIQTILNKAFAHLNKTFGFKGRFLVFNESQNAISFKGQFKQGKSLDDLFEVIKKSIAGNGFVIDNCAQDSFQIITETQSDFMYFFEILKENPLILSQIFRNTVYINPYPFKK